MKKLSKNDYQAIRAWVYRNGRYLDITKWRYFFENGSKEEVLIALSFYQNEDGGFGHGIEPDNQNPNSSPFMISMAAGYLSAIDFSDKDHPIMQGISKYLESGANCSERGWAWSIPSNNHYPCQAYYLYPNAPWYPAGAFSAGDIMANLDLICYVLRAYDINSELVQRALRIADFYIDLLKNSLIDMNAMAEIEQGMVIDHFLWFIDFIEHSGFCGRFDIEVIYADLLKLAAGNHSEKFYRYSGKDNKVDTEKALDDIAERLAMGSPWSAKGLLCEEPEKKYNEIIGANVIYWTMSAVIDDLRRLQQAGRLDL